MNTIDIYAQRIKEIFDECFGEEREAMERAADAIARACVEKRSIFVFGCNHAGLITQELFYRTGGLVTVNPIRAPGMMLEVSPIMMSSQMERMEGYGRILFQSLPARKGDVLLVHSVSGRNAVPIDMAMAAKEQELTVIVLTNKKMSDAVSSRHSSGKRLYDFADILLDNHGDVGDAAVSLDGFPERIAPTSTVIGAAILNAVIVRACEKLWAQGVTPPVFRSGNTDGGDAYNQAVMELYKENIFYL